ncbi:hypothetical protein [Hyphomicrobium sulfonivorans]|uniref:hypothetical protein n=1 Tax=Hyphomicrobium sulfonivorans TaxID=121290 RepID=UPI000837CE7B|nr:hypothetical protein [Hyphomicrobium sulfonivorans]
MALHSPLSLGLTDQQMGQVAEIVLNWAAVDAMLGYCLNLSHSDEGQKLFTTVDIFQKDISEKIRLLSAVRKNVTLPREHAALCKEMLFVCGEWVVERNLVAHGLATTAVNGGPVQLLSERKNYSVPASNLSKFVGHSRYALHVVMRLNAKFAGIKWDPYGPLPERPA